ncbi:MAG: EAL domain-containing protein [Betaproteobacteria bacterium]|nr:EAL domain-containing protein [Betaproteobacteria bacterium]
MFRPVYAAWDKLPVVGKLLLTTGLGLLVAGGLLLQAAAWRDAKDARRELAQQLANDLAMLPTLLAEPLAASDYATLGQILGRYAKRENIAQIRYRSASDKRFDARNAYVKPAAPTLFAVWLAVDDVRGETSLEAGGQRYGTLEIRLNAQPAINEAWAGAKHHLLILGLAISLDFLGIWLVLRKELSPLRALDDSAGKLAAGDLETRIKVGGSPELRRTMAAFNALAEALQEDAEQARLAEETLQEQSSTLRTILDYAPMGIWLLDRDGSLAFVNRACCKAAGIPETGFPSKNDYIKFYGEETMARWKAADAAAFAGSGPHVAKERIALADGKIHDLEITRIPLLDRKGAPGRRLLGLSVDVTARRAAESRLRLLAGVFEHAREGIALTGLDGRIVDVNPSFSKITGYTREDAIGQKPSLLGSGQHDAEFFANMWQSLKSSGHWQGEIWNRRKNGTLYPEWLSIATLSGSEHDADHYLAVFTDITDLKAHQDRLEHLAHYDALTHLPNRVLLADRLQMALSQTRRNGQTLAVGYLDLDEFKPVNDRFGHQFGDRLLIEIARRLVQSLRGGDTVARLGGDEFVLLLNDIESVAECELALARLLHHIAEPMTIDGHCVQVSASIGVTLFPDDDADADALLRHADQSLYLAKESGRNRYHLFDVSHDQGIRARRESRAHVDTALANGQLRLYYQPKVDMRRGKVVGAEALIRWQHPERGLLPPAQFLAAIEGTPTDVAVGEWVIREALRQMQVWREGGLDLRVSVNISPYHLTRNDFIARLSELLAACPDMPHRRLEIEVLETTTLEDIAHVTTLMEDCLWLGVDFALDDFGTGYSSLTYLKRLPAGTLKIDQTFIRDMLKDKDDLAIVEGIVGLAQAFHRTVIAEGVETVEHGVMLLQMGCDQAQGYGIARPMPAGEFPGWVASWQPDPVWILAAGVQCSPLDVALLIGETEHRQWVEALKRHLGEAVVAGPVPGLHEARCRFAQWLAGSGEERHGRSAEFCLIHPAHRRLHAIGHELVTLCESARNDEAREMLPALEAASDEMADAINALLITTSMV